MPTLRGGKEEGKNKERRKKKNVKNIRFEKLYGSIPFFQNSKGFFHSIFIHPWSKERVVAVYSPPLTIVSHVALHISFQK